MTAPFLHVEVEAKDVFTLFERLGARAPEGIALGINRTVEEGLVAVGQLMRRAFTIRELRMLPPLLLPRVWRATPARLQAPMQLGDEEGLGLRRRQIFGKFEAGGTQSADPTRPFAIPTDVLRPSIGTVIPRSKYPRNLVGVFDNQGAYQGLGNKARIVSRSRRRRGLAGRVTDAILGKQVRQKQTGRYFVLGSPGGKFYGIFERTGPGKQDVRQIWRFVHTRTIRGTLQLESTARQIGETRFTPNLEGAFDAVLKQAEGA